MRYYVPSWWGYQTRQKVDQSAIFSLSVVSYFYKPFLILTSHIHSSYYNIIIIIIIIHQKSRFRWISSILRTQQHIALHHICTTAHST